MAEFASPQETQRALEILLDLQSEDPNRLDGILHKYANPFTSWPLLAEPTRAFLSFFETPAQAVETNGVQQNINPKIKELVEEFDREFAAAKDSQVNAETASKKFVKALKEQAKKSNTALPETQAPIPLETEGAPVSPERVQQIVSSAVQYPGPPEEKALVFHALTLFASEQPAQSITNLIPRAIAVTQASRVLVSPEEVIPKEALFSPRAAGVFQQLDTVVNHPERISKNTFGEMTAMWGENFVNSAWFTRLRTDANQMIADQKGTAKIMGKVSSLFSDISTTVFRGPIDQHVITYIETYRMVAAGGVPMTSAPQFGSVALGYGGQLVRMGGSYVIRAGVKAGLKKAAVSGATKLGLEAVAGVATGGSAWVAAAGLSALNWLKDRGVGLFKSLVGMGTSSAPEDKLLLVVGAGVVLVFFLPIFPLLNLPAFNQSMIDTSLATTGAGTGGPNVTGGYATVGGSIGSTTLSCANTSGILVNQCNSSWGSTPYKTAGCTICRGGCGPTSTAMILHAFGSGSSVPNVAGRVAEKDMANFKNYSCSSWIQSNLAVMQEEGLRTIGIGLNWREADKYLKACGLIFALGNTPTSGHFVVITGINWDASGNSVISYATLDPYYPHTTQDSSTFRVTDMFAVVRKAVQ